MWRVIFAGFLYFHNGLCELWPQGVVHFAINAKDYDTHSQDVILSTLEELERETCVKFFQIPTDFNSTDKRILYVTNPDKRKNCLPDTYDFSKPILDMPIGYKCLDKKNIARIVIDMLRASIETTTPTINSYDLIRKFQEEQEDPSHTHLINPIDRNFINLNYHTECRSLSARAPLDSRRSSGNVALSKENQRYYKEKLWPLGILMYGVEKGLEHSAPFSRLKNAMTTIELASCVVFQQVKANATLKPKNLLWFASKGAETPPLGFREGNRSISLMDMVDGAPGHTSHTLNLVMRALGVPMVSSRLDRDNHVIIHWNHVEKGKEHYLEVKPSGAWVRDARLPYDFESVTHAPANYACRDCSAGEMTVEPAHDHLWKRALHMGHHTELSEGDKTILDVLYRKPCAHRYDHNN